MDTIGVLASVMPLGYAFVIFKDFKNPDVPFWPNVLGTLFMCLLALTGLSIGMRFLRFASSGQSWQSDTWVRPVLLGIGFFFPGFVLSLPITMLWVFRTWPGDDGKIDLAFEVSTCLGVIAAIISGIRLFKRRGIRTGHGSLE